MRIVLLILCIFYITRSQAQNSISATYTLGAIPTSFLTYDGSCNGPSTVINITLPAGDNYQVTNVHVVYNMTALGGGWISDQRSKMKLSNNAMEESEVSGVGNVGGTYMYSRDMSIANGTYPGGTMLTFEMWTFRIWDPNPNTAGCNTTYNRVDAGTWTITVYYSNQIVTPKVGINLTAPVSTLDVNGKIKIGNDTTTPMAGMIRWNSTTQDFEGYNGTNWVSLTRESGGWGSDPTVSQLTQATSPDGAEEDHLGYSVAISGDYAIAGAPNKTVGINMNQGRAYIFKRNGSTWIEQISLSASDGGVSDYFGISVSISGDYAIVGAIQDGGVGKAYIFIRNGTSWSQQAILTASDGAANDYFGNSVSIAGNYAIVGAHLHDVGPNQNQGEAYVFLRNGTSWSQQAILVASNGIAEGLFGQSVSINGDYIIIGAVGQTIGGKAYIFKRTDTSWSQQAVLSASDAIPLDNFGRSVSISGNYAIVGSPLHSTGGNNNQGNAYIYNRVGTTWTQQVIISASDGYPGDLFGTSVSISGDYALIGSIHHGAEGNADQGSAYVFIRNAAAWSQQSILVSTGGASLDNFGNGVSISGNSIIVGAPLYDVNTFSDQGVVYFY